MSSLYGLGQKVVIFDFLVRTTLNGEAIEDLKNYWTNPPSKLNTSGAWGRIKYNVWIPRSVWKSRVLKGSKFLNGKYANPTLPLEGIITQEVVFQDGVVEADEYGVMFSGINHRKGYKVSYDLRRKPLLVSEDMLREV